MKKLIILTATLFALTAGNLFAQSADVDVTATIEGSLSIVNEADVEFGTVQAGEEHVISNTVNEANLGRVFIQGQGSQTVFFDTEGSVDLTGPGDDITATLAYFGNESNDASGSTTLNNSEELSAAGDYYVFIGATINPPNTQQNGSYSATTTISVSYTSF